MKTVDSIMTEAHLRLKLRLLDDGYLNEVTLPYLKVSYRNGILDELDGRDDLIEDEAEEFVVNRILEDVKVSDYDALLRDVEKCMKDNDL